jgi:hypothetical protein
MATKKTEVQVANDEPLFVQEAPAWAQSKEARGSENVTNADMVLPRLEIVQALSPIKDENPDAREGCLFNSATVAVIGDSAYIVPIFYRMEWLVWKDQNKGGGFFGAYDSEAAAAARVREEVENGEDEEDLEVVDTPVHYCLRIVPDPKAEGGMRTEQIVISMAKTKAKVSRKWNAMIQIAGGDRFSRVYKLSTFKDKNKQGKTFYNYVVTPQGFPPEHVYREAERVYGVLKAGDIKVDHAAGGAYGDDNTSGGGDPGEI